MENVAKTVPTNSMLADSGIAVTAKNGFMRQPLTHDLRSHKKYQGKIIIATRLYFTWLILKNNTLSVQKAELDGSSLYI
ncbi:hypothetical protein B5V02_27695 [Mesorhizobium kowhaii]|uniref:Uncharacterized protein n=1 Tax=Mesorhizobium kowhaii TaxID=1300272 RepID=A0A2W7CNI8_9HYPH|nr:hypothetical protein B5V02_27695 [Mesorhizobium kowhaii]